jgi:hypothetical protein
MYSSGTHVSRDWCTNQEQLSSVDNAFKIWSPIITELEKFRKYPRHIILCYQFHRANQFLKVERLSASQEMPLFYETQILTTVVTVPATRSHPEPF